MSGRSAGASPVRRQHRRDLVKLTAFLTVAALFTFWVGAVVAEYRGGERSSYDAVFTNVSGLQVGDQVRVAGVTTGKVREIEVLDDATVRVTFDVRDGLELDGSTGAAVQYRNLIGDRVLVLTRGEEGAPVLPPGGTIPVERTASALDLDTLLNGFKPLFAGLSPQQINALSADLVQVLQGQRSAITTLVQQVASFTTAIADRDELVTSVVANLNDVVGTFDERRGTVGELIDNLEALLTGLDGQDGQLLDAAAEVDVLARDAASLIRAARGDLAPGLRSLTVAARGINEESSTLEQVLEALPRHYSALQNTASYGNFFNFYLCGVRVQTGGSGEGVVTTPWILSDAARCAR